MTHSIKPGKPSLSAWGYVKLCLRKYVDGNGRARRREYWFFILFQIALLLIPYLLGIALAAMGDQAGDAGLTGIGALILIVTGIAYLGFVLPTITAMIRRFHDVGLSGWLILLGLVPYIGGIITFVISVLPSQDHANKHGPVPDTQTPSVSEIFA